ncbi:MAG: glycosyltransferase family 2 protein [Candidatus ainarchaeum sp.]|nr:glycosyltransferase family 2 protein [Candidatus ainarchaeum sp.]
MKKKMPFLSVIIPTYNSGEKLLKLIKSIFASGYKNFEVIVVDDCGTDNSIELIKKYPVKIIRLKKNSGQSVARNTGAEAAKSDILVFFDSDVVLKKDVLEKFAEFFLGPENQCIVGIYAKEPANKAWFAKYRGLLEFSWYLDTTNFDCFTPASGAMRRSLFDKIGGFDKKYRHMEENEMGYKIIQICPIVLRNDIQVHHHFPTFQKCARLYFKRCFVWTRLFLKRKKFDNAATTASVGFGALAAFFTLFFLLFAPVTVYALYLSGLSFLFFLFLNRVTLRFVLKNSGFLFLLYFIATNFILMIVVGFSAIFSVLTVPFFGIEERWLK